MNPKCHPSDMLMMDFAASRASHGARLAIGVHLADCRRCRRLLAALVELGGLNLDQIAPVPMSSGTALKARLHAGAVAQSDELLEWDATAEIAKAARGLHWAGPGLALCAMPLPAPKERAYLVQVQPGASIPHHTHTGRELVAVWAGGFSDGRSDFTAGDFIEARKSEEHRLVAHLGQPCICLIVLEDRIRLSGFARWLQPLIGL